MRVTASRSRVPAPPQVLEQILALGLADVVLAGAGSIGVDGWLERRRACAALTRRLLSSTRLPEADQRTIERLARSDLARGKQSSRRSRLTGDSTATGSPSCVISIDSPARTRLIVFVRMSRSSRKPMARHCGQCYPSPRALPAARSRHTFDPPRTRAGRGSPTDRRPAGPASTLTYAASSRSAKRRSTSSFSGPS